MDVVSICRAYVDLVLSVTEKELNGLGFNIDDDIPLAEEPFQNLIEQYAERGELLPGGPAANTMATIALLGGKTAFIGKIANDELGTAFQKDFERRGVTFNMNIEHDKGTPSIIIFVTPDGERTIAYNSGIADEITKDDIELNKEPLSQTKYLYLGLVTRSPKCVEIIKLAREYAKQAKIVTTLQNYQKTEDFFRANNTISGDIIVGNENEFKKFLSDLNTESLESLSQEYPDKIFACTLGAQGAVITTNSETVSVPSIPVNEVIDTTGAGDAWTGGFLFGLSNNLPLAEAGKIGAECAAKILTETGGRLPHV